MGKYTAILKAHRLAQRPLEPEPSKPSFEGAYLRPTSPVEPPKSDDGKDRLRGKIRRAIARGDRAHGIILAIDNGLKDEFIEGRSEG
jgi:hypothetical protein